MIPHKFIKNWQLTQKVVVRTCFKEQKKLEDPVLA
jgi:hypothetical protein